DDVLIMLFLLAESVAVRMRELASRCTVVEVYVRDTELNSFTRQRKLQTPTSSSAEIAETAYDLFRRNYYWGKPIRSIGVRGAGLVEATDELQLSCFPDDALRDKWERIDRTMDRLRQRFGYTSIQRAIVQTEPLLAGINPKDDHTIHPIGYFAG
ncbi:MAG: DNA polymerase IV, partial [Oscillospiraceae bacterium]|nr:DNA polymerase IV [Oscillospiraceae bacterium]